MDIESKKRILGYVLKGLVPPGVVYYQCTVKEDFACLIHIILGDGDAVYGFLDQHDQLFLIDVWEWYELGGLRTFAQARKIEPVEITE